MPAAMDIASEKQMLRKLVRERARAIPTEARVALSEQACARVLEHLFPEDTRLRLGSVLLYMPLQDELDVTSLLQALLQKGRRVALPRFDPEQGNYRAFFAGDKPLQTGRFGVLEPGPDLPVPLNQLDLVLVPGLGFDARGRRLGRGKGFYDRILSEASGVKCGICFDEQLLDAIPVEPHDHGVDYLATPSRWLDCRGSTPE